MNVRRNKLAEIFEKLDSDKDGWVSSGKFETTGISEEVMRAFGPLF